MLAIQASRTRDIAVEHHYPCHEIDCPAILSILVEEREPHMQETFYQYNLITTLAKKYSHSTYLASPIDDPEQRLVLLAFDTSLSFAFPHESDKILQKAQQIKDLQHPHLLPILDMGIADEQPFVVRDYLPNSSLRDHLKQISPQRLKLREALTIVLQVGEALA